MPLTPADIKFFAATVNTDAADGGGRRSSAIVQTGVLNNLFPDVSASDRVAGITRVRKIYPSLTNADDTPLLGASLVLNALPTDPATQVAMWRFGGAATTRNEALLNLDDGVADSPLAGGSFSGGTATAGSDTVTGAIFPDSAYFDSSVVGQWVRLQVLVSGSFRYALRQVLSRVSGTLVFNSALPFSGIVTGRWVIAAGASARSNTPGSVYGAVPIRSAVTAGATSVTLTKLGVQTLPAPDGGATFGSESLGHAACVYFGDTVTLSDEQATTAATATVGTVSVGRTNLDQLAVVGANGLEIARFVLDGPTPTPTSGAMTCDLAAGTVTFSSVAGFSQPVTVRHRIAQTTTVAGVNGPAITLANALTRDFPAGSLLSSHMALGDVQARAYGGFAQQSWTRVFSDTLIGNSVPAMYSGLPAVTNQGAASDRWAVVFTAGNEFTVYSEALGQIGGGNTTSNYSPINPATGVAFFILAAANWGASNLVGSVFRFNTEAAAPPAWVSRCTVPSAAAGTTSVGLRLLGSV